MESLEELQKTFAANASIIMLDNFSREDTMTAVVLNNVKAKFEASGNITNEALFSTAETGLDFISIGTLTKHVRAVDLSVRIIG